MASNFFFFFFNLFFLFLFSTCVAINNVTSTKPPLIAPDAFCNSTLYPKFCKSILPRDKSCNLHDSAQFSIRRSLSSARKFLRLIDKYLKHRSKLTKSAIRALEDCKLLSALNIDFLSTTFMSLNSTNPFLSVETEDLQTMLSAIVTNHQTCLDGIRATASAWSLRNEIYYPLSNGTKLYSVSLALFTQGWVHKKKKKCKCLKKKSERKLLFSDMEVVEVHGRLVLPLRMSRRNRKIFERVSRSRTLLGDEEEYSSVLVSDIAVVNPDGSENFATITDAVAAAPNNSNSSTDGFFLIYIVGGVYEEYVSIGKNKKNLMMIGDGINQTVITGNRSFVDGWTTFNSATFAVVGEGFVAIDITFQNTAGAIKHQAVAVRNGADLSTFYRCSFEGYQDTLYAHSLRQFYRECDIYGTVDFIFGNAAVVFQNCNIYAKLPMPNQFNSITAQGRTDPNQNTGTSIHNCSILAAPDLRVALRNGTTMTKAKTKTYLGRPWKEYSRTVYMQSFIDGFIEPSGWSPWLGDFALRTLYYGEYNNTGKGSNIKKRVGWSGYHVIVTATDAANFTVSNLISGDDWLPGTGVYYLSGLLRTK